MAEPTVKLSAMPSDPHDGLVSPPSSTGDETKPALKNVFKERQSRQLRNLLSSLEDIVDDFESADSAVVVEAPIHEQCNAKNWKSFLPYLKLSFDGDGYTESPLPNEDRKSTKPLQLVETDGRKVVELWSERLQQIFLDVVDVSPYHGVTVSSASITITAPYVPLFHELDRLKDAIDKDKIVSEDERNHFEALYYYTTLDAPQKHFKDVRRLLNHNGVLYENIWAMYSAQSLVVSRDHLDNWVISDVLSVKFEEDNRYVGYARHRWFITTSSIDRVGGKYQRLIQKRRLETFDGVKKIRDLDFFPIEYLEDQDALKAAAIVRGKEWKRFCECEPMVMSYEGQALSWSRASPPYTPPDSAVDFSPVYLSATIIVDPNAQGRLNKQSIVDEAPLNNMEVNHSDVRSHRPLNKSSFTDDDFLRCPATQSVFDLDMHEWYSVKIADIKPKEWQPESFDRLVMDPARKNILKRITTTSLDKMGSTTQDAIEGKGKGLVLLLYGPPGVGKTMTAEALSQLTRKPLLKVNLGRLSSHKRWEQALEQVFENGEAWKAILLIDEAEVVLEKRTFERMIQNSWISVFLRKLEYYQGVLILTTNLIDCMDDAFESRISYPIQFMELSQEDRKQIWIGFIQHLKLLDSYKKGMLEEVDRWSQAEVNGRQIRNIFTMAENLARSDTRSPRLTPEHIDKILDVTIEFTEWNKHKDSKKKKGYLTY